MTARRELTDMPKVPDNFQMRFDLDTADAVRKVSVLKSMTDAVLKDLALIEKRADKVARKLKKARS